MFGPAATLDCVRELQVLSGDVHQPQALGISRGLREQGYALMCTSFPRSDAVLQCIEVGSETLPASLQRLLCVCANQWSCTCKNQMHSQRLIVACVRQQSL